ncbi:MAG: DUF5615 family PIN-like protein [Planctomycetes bacterium]|nr:DUF5615 family PIN-like protein [Planctomycetota bacterium]
MARELQTAFPGWRHVHDVGLGADEDHRLWDYAKRKGLSIVTKDADFADLVGLRSAPPKVIWLRVGNRTTGQLCQILAWATERVRVFLEDPEAELLEICADGEGRPDPRFWRRGAAW